MAEPGDPVMIVVGGGAIALDTAQELCALQGHRVVVLWHRDPDFTRAVEDIGAVHIAAARPDSTDALDRAGVRDAVTILALSPDDQLNLHAALLARDANPRIRIVLRQFNRTLAYKIEQNLPNCSVLSLARHSAATYAAAGVDPSCFRGLQFPERDGPLTGFATRIAESCGVGGETVAGAERVLGAHILAVDRKTGLSRDTVLAGRAELVVYGNVAGLQGSAPRPPAARSHRALGLRLRSLLRPGRRQPPRLNPILVRLALAALVAFLLGTWYFHTAFKGGWLDAVYFVVATMTTTGYGDLSPDRSNPVDIVAAIFADAGGHHHHRPLHRFRRLVADTGALGKACARCIVAGTSSFAAPAVSAAR